MNNPGTPILLIDGLTKVFTQNKSENKVFDGLSLDVKDAEIVSIVGPSGCGKSTLLNIIAGFDRDYNGRLLFEGEEISGPSGRRVMIFQNPQLFSWLNVKENISFGLKRKGMSKEEIESLTESYLLRIDMSDFRGYFPHQLSGGMQQRVELARALIMKPRLLLMDEPFSALDYQSRLGMQRLLLNLWNEYKPSILFVTHDIEESILIADRIIVLSKRPGRIVEALDVPFERPRDISLIKSVDFHHIKSRIFDLLAG